MQRKVKESKVKSIVDTNVSMEDAEHPTQERIDYNMFIIFFNEAIQSLLKQ